MESLNIQRVSKRFHEMFESKLDTSDIGETDYHFETRALAAMALMMKCGLDEEQAASNITDGYHDLGIDAIFLDDPQRILYIVQSKWRNKGEGSINQEEMNTFVSGLKRVLHYELKGANGKIQDKQAEIDRALGGIGYSIEAIFIHTGSGMVNDYIMKPLQDLMETTNDDAGDILHFSQITFKEIYDYLAGAGIADSITIDDVVMNNWGKIEEPYLSYYGLIPAVAVGEWYSKYGNKLFAQNLRFYKGRTDVNEGIIKTLTQEPQNFVYYNNGIKLLCKRIIRKAKNSTNNQTGIFNLEGVSVINGAQTTGSIGRVYADDPSKLEHVQTMVQIIEMREMPDEIAKTITKLSNTQNRIENKDFAAQDPVQDRLRRELSFSHYQYLYKTGDDVNDSSTQISFDEAIISLACLSADVAYANMAKRNVGALSEDISKSPYKILFNGSTNAFELLNAVLVVREIEKQLQEFKETALGKKYATCVHGNRLIEHVILQDLKRRFDFTTKVVDMRELMGLISEELEVVVSSFSEELEGIYKESYPANVFKNMSKSKVLSEAASVAVRNVEAFV